MAQVQHFDPSADPYRNNSVNKAGTKLMYNK